MVPTMREERSAKKTAADGGEPPHVEADQPTAALAGEGTLDGSAPATETQPPAQAKISKAAAKALARTANAHALVPGGVGGIDSFEQGSRPTLKDLVAELTDRVGEEKYRDLMKGKKEARKIIGNLLMATPIAVAVAVAAATAAPAAGAGAGDGVPVITVAPKQRRWKHTPCIAHMANYIQRYPRYTYAARWRRQQPPPPASPPPPRPPEAPSSAFERRKCAVLTIPMAEILIRVQIRAFLQRRTICLN